VIGRIVRSIDFERVLNAPTRARSLHFAVHHLDSVPSVPGPRSNPVDAIQLSTGDAPQKGVSVDEVIRKAPPDRLWLGAVVPKRHARRSVTRSLLKRHIRAAVSRQTRLPGGLWVVRLRAPFRPDQYVSATSNALSQAARDELDDVLAAAVRRPVPA